MKKTGAQIIWECLVRQGVTDVFGYPGGAILPTYDAMLDYPIRHVLVRHEQGATHMADGYARASGRVGVAIATSGPGATNMVTGIATAMLDSSPIVCITGQVGSKLIGSDAFQESDVTGVTLPITKHNYLVTRAEDIAPTFREAFEIAAGGRPGPVHIDVTKDAQQSSCEFDWDAAAPKKPAFRPDWSARPEEFQRALELINSAERPIILAGHGVMLSNAMDIVRAFAEKAHVPVSPTLPFRLGEKTDDPLAMYLNDIYSIPASLAGVPALSFPAGFTKAGLPIGLQLVGKPFDEGTLLRIARAWESASDAARRVPPIAMEAAA